MEVLADAPPQTHPLESVGELRGDPLPLRGGPLALARFMRANHMLGRNYWRLLARLAMLKLRFGKRLQTDGICFICPGAKLEIGRGATLRIGRWAWIGHDCKIRVHEGEVSIGAKTVMGQECTISAFQHVSIGRECIIADRVMMIDFDHGVTEVERPIRTQGIYKRDVRVGHNVWIGYGASILRGVSVGDNSVIGTSAVLTKGFPANSVLAGVPARIIRMRKAPRAMRWKDPNEGAAVSPVPPARSRSQQDSRVGIDGEVAKAD
jgi:acetyltransferase-like isoleucine patch superfamily enzyme